MSLDLKKYAIRTDSSAASIKALEILIDCKFSAHDSCYWGEYWIFRHSIENHSIRVYHNFDPMWDSNNDDPDEEYFEFEYKEYSMLIDVCGSSDWVKQLSSKIKTIQNIVFVK